MMLSINTYLHILYQYVR